MGVYGIAVLGFFFMQYVGNFDFNVWYCGIIRPCGMRYFIILADGIRGNMIVLGFAGGTVVYVFLSIQYTKQNRVRHKGQ